MLEYFVSLHKSKTASLHRCEHNKRKSRCRDCKGSAFCYHGTRKEVCVPCGGSSMCKHKRERRMCKECKLAGEGGASLCVHFKKKRDCKDCITFITTFAQHL